MAGNSLKIGVLAVQGAVVPHLEKLTALGVEAVEVKTPKDLVDLQGIILPGGESSAMIHLLKVNKLWEPLKEFVHQKPSWGVCAGMILLAESVTGPVQESLQAINIEVKRNAYGRQAESFISLLEAGPHWKESTKSVEGVFIRAPRIRAISGGVHTLFFCRGEAVMVEEGKTLAASFHPELTEALTLHQYFVDKCRQFALQS